MRTIFAVFTAISSLFIGFYAVSEAAQQSYGTASNTTAGHSAWNTTHDVFGGVGEAAAPGLVWMGIAAAILVMLGFLVVAGRSGGR